MENRQNLHLSINGRIYVNNANHKTHKTERIVMNTQTKKLFSLIIISFILCACSQYKQEMNEQTFWQLMDKAREKSGPDMEKRYNTLVNMLTAYEPIAILRFKNIADIYTNAAAENMGMWAVCKIIEGPACDDVYMNFCCWLVTEGKETYLNAVKNPETLATNKIRSYNEHSIEILSFAAFDAYKQKTGKSIDEIPDSMVDILSTEYEQLLTTLLKNIEFMDDTPFKGSKIDVMRQIPNLLPQLTTMFGFNAEKEIQVWEELP